MGRQSGIAQVEHDEARKETKIPRSTIPQRKIEIGVYSRTSKLDEYANFGKDDVAWEESESMGARSLEQQL